MDADSQIEGGECCTMVLLGAVEEIGEMRQSWGQRTRGTIWATFI